jgi:hypothetical protein
VGCFGFLNSPGPLPSFLLHFSEEGRRIGVISPELSTTLLPLPAKLVDLGLLNLEFRSKLAFGVRGWPCVGCEPPCWGP